MLQTDLSSFSYKKGTLVPWCKRCGAENFLRRGKNPLGLTRYQCRACGFRFVWTSDLPRRHIFSNIIAFAVDLYTRTRVAASLAGVRDILRQAFNVVVSRECIRQWILKATTCIIPNGTTAKTWHIDETYIKIKGRGWWLWIVYCRENSSVLAWRLSKTRLYQDAFALVKQALHAARGVRPECIITDGLWQYPVAIYKVMGWTWKEHKTRHIVDSGIGKNAFIERLNREIKRRVKYFSTFQCLEGANAFFALWFYHHNQRHLS
jgi:putative transposase